LIVGTLFAHRVLGMNPVVVCGALAGAMTVDAAVAGACDVAQSQTPVLGVAVPYALANVVLTVLGPIIVGLLSTGKSCAWSNVVARFSREAGSNDRLRIGNES
jgi:putative transport protein